MADISTESKQHIEQIADDVLNQLGHIASAAKDKLNVSHTPGADTFANINTMTSGSAIAKLNKASQANQESYRILANEPAIARVMVVDEKDEERTYYICRTTPVSGVSNLASYRAPVGRLASLEVGSEFTFPNGKVVEVLERAQLQPSLLADGWDSKGTIIETEHFGPLSIESLRELRYEGVDEEDIEDILSQFLAEDNAISNIIEGVKRSLITKMGLRDQPILDQYQDEIFRLPLNKRLLILGPPGTGKTTTLIRRLGQKLDVEFLEDSEKHLVEITQTSKGFAHKESWLMFTPTELLKQYLKEAFAREGVPASDRCIRTWHDYRHELARNTFSVLRTASGSGNFVLKEGLLSLEESALDNPIEWFDDFKAWQRDFYIQDLLSAATKLHEEAENMDVQQLGERLQNILTRSSEQALPSMISSLATEIPKVQKLVDDLKETTDKKIKAALNLQLNHNRSFLDDLAQFIDSLQQAQISDSEEQDDLDDEEEDTTPSSTGRAVALKVYMQAVKAQARSAVTKRMPSKTSRTGKIIEWLADRGLAEAERVEVGGSLLVQASARRFVNPVRRYINGIPQRYRSFRRERQKEGQWYNKENFEARDIHPLELDVILLTILRTANDLLARPNILRDIDSPLWSPLLPMFGHYRNQILVDEATDFSPIQLACMAALAHPGLRSFFACGDFNQRLTTWGTQSTEELKWVFSDFDIREINITYRQSKQLNELARAMIEVVGGSEQNVSLPAHIDSNGVPPALLEYAEDTSAVISWLAERIQEIERFVGQLPSIAIFVNSEDNVAFLAEALNDVLLENNIQVIACREGQSVGQENDVRVFDLQHIKGLEFEAVFFVGIDQLAAQHPDLFDKYLYVGITRAATYLGITCNNTLPESIESLRSHFGETWHK